MKFNASLLKTYMGCPLQARFQEIEKLPRLNNAKAVFGTCIHAALEDYNKTGDAKAAIAYFKDLWDDPSKLGRPIDVWPKFTTYGGLRKRGIEIIQEYADHHKWETRTVVATEHKFCVPFGEHLLSGIVDLVEKKKSTKGKPVLRIVDYKTNSKQPNLVQLRLDIQFCADDTTEILTRRGWKLYDEVIVGEDVLTLNQQTGMSEWQPATSVNVFATNNQVLVSLEGKDHSSLTTKNHRWPVKHYVSGRNGWRIEDRIVTSESLTGADRIMCAAPTDSLPVESKYSDAFVELVSWFWTEGHMIRGGSCSIAQSETINPDLVNRIERALIIEFGPEVDSLRNTHVPAWRVSRDEDCVRFYLNRSASELISAVFDDFKEKVIHGRFISELTKSQLEIFVDVSIQADGWMNNGSAVISQSVRSRLDPLQMAYSLLGIRTCLREYRLRGRGPYSGVTHYVLSTKSKTPYFVPSLHKRSEVEHTGKVWCPTTANGTWLSRRNGMVSYTGNTIYDYASRQPEFWMGFEDDQRYRGLPDGEKLYEMYQNMDRKLIWYHLWGNKEINAGDRDDMDMMRLYRVLNEVERAVTHEIYVPNISGDTCTYCDYVDRCGVVVPVHEKFQTEIPEDS